MNFITFSCQTTNLFPCSNSTMGGQLVTEYNLKSRESVATDSAIQYNVGHSFVHSQSDFEVTILQDSGGVIINPYTLEISEGRGVINGHFVETLAPMTIDLVEANLTLLSQSKAALKGELAIGIRTFFATDQTVAGSILVENEEDMFLGIQLVILPEKEMVTPADSPDDISKVNVDLVLAKFTFINNVISGLTNLPDKIQYLDSERIKNLSTIVSDQFITKTGLNSKKLYVFAGKGFDPSTGKDTWEDATDSLIIWDSEPKRTSEKPLIKQTELVVGESEAYFILPHKQVTGMTDDYDEYQYYEPRKIDLPIANYATNSTGLVTKEFTKQIKSIAEGMQKFRSFVNGKQIYFIETRGVYDELPAISTSWNIGDYILVEYDDHYIGEASDSETSPSTMYVILPGYVETIKFVTQVDGDAISDSPVPSNLTGVELGHQDWYESSGQEPPETEIPEYYPQFFSDDEIRGIPGDEATNEWVDYFRLRYFKADSETYAYTDYYYAVLTSGPHAWSDALLLTGSIPFASEEVIGGFLNASTEATDYGYVYLDDTGHLRLIDYELLRSGTLAYQIGTDLSLPETESLSELQEEINEFVNDRVAFPTTPEHGTTSAVVNIYITVPDTDEGGILNIAGIDSRFNTAVCIHILGEAKSNTIINISDCQKLMIDPVIEGSPVVNIYRCCLYYEPNVFEYVRTCNRDSSVFGSFTGFQDLSLWYEQIEADNPSLMVNGMTVSEIDSPIITSNINYWKEMGTAINDNNYLVALKSISFSGTGDITGCEILVANNSTDNIMPGDKIIVGECPLLQGDNLVYPISCLTRILKVSGSFTSAYYSDSNWYVTDNTFSYQTGVYSPIDTSKVMSGVVAFHSVTTLVPNTLSQTSISPWEPDSYHIFRGGAVS